MGLVQSFINQIGRDAARDVYRSGSKKLKTLVTNSSEGFTNQGILNEIKNFELYSTEDTTFLELSNLIEKAEHSEVNNFDWEEIFLELDNKIEFCKESLEPTYKAKLQALDEKNQVNFLNKKNQHLAVLHELLKNLKKANDSSINPMGSMVFVTAFLGITPIYFRQSAARIVLYIITIGIVAVCFFYGYMFLSYPSQFIANSKMDVQESLRAARSLGITLLVLGSIFYALIAVSSLKHIRRKRDEYTAKEEYLLLLEQYLSSYQ
jgi:hypothetical protein